MSKPKIFCFSNVPGGGDGIAYAMAENARLQGILDQAAPLAEKATAEIDRLWDENVRLQSIRWRLPSLRKIGAYP